MRLSLRRKAKWPFEPGVGADANLAQTLQVLRGKWGEVPLSEEGRARSEELMTLSDENLLKVWSEGLLDSSTGKAFDARGWYQLLYKDIFRGKKVMDVGSGLGFDSVTYAEAGAHMTCVDIVESNLEIVTRICKVKGLTNLSFCHLKDLSSLDRLPANYDAIYCQGSLINAPLEVTRIEAQALLKHLPVGGRWIELAYPKRRWVRDGRMPFTKWGRKTDGGAPWMEWHDLEKVKTFLAPAQFEVVFTLDFHHSDFNWFDLIRRS
jgi:SAM-dependent methyltransferase